MNIKILHLIEEARKATGLTVIIDVFCAFSVESYFFAKGAKEIIAVGDTAVAYTLKKQNPNMILAGERHGAILPGFDTGNSSSQLMTINAEGKTVIHTTSAGTQGIVNAIHADEILCCGLVNAGATANYIRNSGAKEDFYMCTALDKFDFVLKHEKGQDGLDYIKSNCDQTVKRKKEV